VLNWHEEDIYGYLPFNYRSNFLKAATMVGGPLRNLPNKHGQKVPTHSCGSDIEWMTKQVLHDIKRFKYATLPQMPLGCSSFPTSEPPEMAL